MTMGVTSPEHVAKKQKLTDSNTDADLKEHTHVEKKQKLTDSNTDADLKDATIQVRLHYIFFCIRIKSAPEQSYIIDLRISLNLPWDFN